MVTLKMGLSFRQLQVWMFLVALVAGLAGGALAQQSSLPTNLLFIAAEDGTIPIYDLTNPSSGPVATITGVPCFQKQMVVDKSGDLFVLNQGLSAICFTIAEYLPPYNTPPIRLQTSWQGQAFFAAGITVDVSGTVFVANTGEYLSETPAIFVYPPGSTVPTQRIPITSSKFDSLGELALDKQGNVYAAGWSTTTLGADVFVMPHGSTTPMPLGLEGLHSVPCCQNGVSLDAQGDLYVLVAGAFPVYILEYKPGQRRPVRVIDSFTIFNPSITPTGIDTGPDGNLYVGIDCTFQTCAQVEGFKPGHGLPFEFVGSQQGLSFVGGVATAPNPKL